MNIWVALLLIAIASGISSYISTKRAFAAGQKSVKVFPKPKFGLSVAEAVKATLGGLNPVQAQAAKVAAAVVGMEITLDDEIVQVRNHLAVRKEESLKAIHDYQQEIAAEQEKINRAVSRDTEIADLATAFATA